MYCSRSVLCSLAVGCQHGYRVDVSLTTALYRWLYRPHVALARRQVTAASLVPHSAGLSGPLHEVSVADAVFRSSVCDPLGSPIWLAVTVCIVLALVRVYFDYSLLGLRFQFLSGIPCAL
jgi:hypothetical protein